MTRAQSTSRIPQIVRQHEHAILSDWIKLQLVGVSSRRDLMNESELQRQSREFLSAFAAAAERGLENLHGPQWIPVRDLLASLSRSRALQGFTPSETATFVLSLKQPLFTQLRTSVNDMNELADEIWLATTVLDELGLFTTETFLKNREEVIARQQHELLELSTPVVTLWDGILALPLIGTLDSARTQVVMESLLERIVATGSSIAILDITGVPTVDTLVAQHLLKTVAAARLMGADCIISGIRPQIAQTIVHLGVDLNSVTTKSTLADAFKVAMARTGLAVVQRNGASGQQKRGGSTMPAAAAAPTPEA